MANLSFTAPIRFMNLSVSVMNLFNKKCNEYEFIRSGGDFGTASAFLFLRERDGRCVEPGGVNPVLAGRDQWEGVRLAYSDLAWRRRGRLGSAVCQRARKF